MFRLFDRLQRATQSTRVWCHVKTKQAHTFLCGSWGTTHFLPQSNCAGTQLGFVLCNELKEGFASIVGNTSLTL